VVILPNEIVIVADTRERYPLLFPKTIACWELGKRKIVKVKKKKEKLETGDYLLENYSHLGIVERKGSVSEISSNLFSSDSARQLRAFSRLQKTCKYPILFLEMNPYQLLKGPYHMPGVDSSILLSKLMVVLSRYYFHLLWFPWAKSTTGRLLAGEVILHLLLSYVVAEATCTTETFEAGG